MDTDKENVVAGSKESSRRNSKASKQSPKSTEVSSKVSYLLPLTISLIILNITRRPAAR